MRPYLIPVLLVAALLTSSAVAGDKTTCSDVLASLKGKPERLQFLGCKHRTDLQGAPFEARYRVRGRYAAGVEHYLITEFKIKELHHTCCVWESTQNSYRDERLGSLVIEMSTAETTVADKAEWHKISHFYVIVDRYTEEP